MINISLRNYRGFSTSSPAEFCIGKGFTAFVGRNNAGKSTCIRAIYELRNIFQRADTWTGGVVGPTGFNVESEPDLTAIFNYGNEDPILVTLSIEPPAGITDYCLIKATISLDRNGTFQLVSAVISNSNDSHLLRTPFRSIQHIALPSGRGVQLTPSNMTSMVYVTQPFSDALDMLSKSIYFGPYRNAINEGAARHYDISVGTGLITQWDDWKAGVNVASKRAISRVEADIERLLGHRSVEINASSDNKTLNVTVDKHPFKLADLGAGVAELIISLSTALVKKTAFYSYR